MVQALNSEAKSIYGNPWRFDQWSLTLQGQFFQRYGEAKAREFAKAAGTKFGATKPIDDATAQRIIEVRNFIMTKKIVEPGGGGGISGTGMPT